MTVNEITAALTARRDKTYWERGVTKYALDLLYDLPLMMELHLANNQTKWESGLTLRALLLNGARDWKQFSYGGCALICDEQICDRLATPSEKIHCQYGRWRPNRNEEWLDVQARALAQAYARICSYVREAENETALQSA